MDGETAVDDIGNEENASCKQLESQENEVRVYRNGLRKRRGFKGIVDKWMIMHMITIVFFTVAAAVVFLHTGMLWYQYMNHRSHRVTLNDLYITQESVTLVQNIKDQCKIHQSELPEKKLVVNTSLYFW